MEQLKHIIQSLDFPSSYELKNLALHDSAFATKTRHLSTEDNKFNTYSEGNAHSTWAFTSIEKYFSSAARACQILEIFLDKRVQCNAYLTPSNSQGLPIHYDLHDVLVLQLEGTKDWKVWPAFRKRVSANTLLEDEQQNLPMWTKSSPSFSGRLKKGEVIYLKTAEPHVAIATNETSLHLSFGIYRD
jgi:hypothetical protein